jgi:hypothetical protein
MWYQLKRHPLPVSAYFKHSLVLTFALPAEVLEPLLPPGLELDRYRDYGFIAIALVQTRGLHPTCVPESLGQDFILSGYRVFSRYTTLEGRHLRGLRILRSDTDRRLMAVAGNLLTHYHYHLAKVDWREAEAALDVEVRTPHAEADLSVHAEFPVDSPSLPLDSPFSNWEAAREYAGPLPYTFDYEAETNSLILIKGVRKQWNPQPVQVKLRRITFFNRPEFRGVRPILASAFHVANISYEWQKGRREVLPEAS